MATAEKTGIKVQVGPFDHVVPLVLNDLSGWLVDCIASMQERLQTLEAALKNIPVTSEDFDFIGEVPAIFKNLVDMFAFAAEEEKAELMENGMQSLQLCAPTSVRTMKVYDSMQRENVLFLETNLFWLLDLPDICTEKETNESKSVNAQNSYYEQYVERRKTTQSLVCNDVAVQTLSAACRNTHVQTKHHSVHNESSVSTGWILFDAYSQSSTPSQKVALKNLDAGLFFMERSISWNVYHSLLVVLKSHRKILNSKNCISKIPLTFHTSETKHFQVTSLAWEPNNSNIFAVGYSAQKENDCGIDGGRVECWSLKNCCYPERNLKTPTGVTSLCFSQTEHVLLAVALNDGEIWILDIHCKPCKVVAKNTSNEDRPFATIWQISWAWIRGVANEKSEILVSASEDGRVFQWSLQGSFLECTRLTRIRLSEVGPQTALVPYAFACCVAYNPVPPHHYLVATHEGHIYKYSLDCNDRFLVAFRYHSSIVYRVAWSPFDCTIFASCSIDGTVALWRDGSERPKIVVVSRLHRGFVDVVWSSLSATIFVAITDITIELWDVAFSIWQPLDVYETEASVYLTSVVTIPHTNNILVGCTNGQTICFAVDCGCFPESDESTLARVLDSAPEVN